MTLNEWHILVQFALIDEHDDAANVLLRQQPDGRWGLPGGIVQRPPIHATAAAKLRAQTGARAAAELGSLGTFDTTTPDGAPVLVFLFEGPLPPDTLRLRDDIRWIDSLTFDGPTDDMAPWTITLAHLHDHLRHPDRNTPLPGPIALPNTTTQP